MAQSAHDQACERETALLEEKSLLKTAVTAAIAQKEALEGALGALQREHTALVNESVNLRNQVRMRAGASGTSGIHLEMFIFKSYLECKRPVDDNWLHNVLSPMRPIFISLYSYVCR